MQSYEENHLLEISLEEGVQRGKIMLRSFKKLHDTYLQKKDALMKSQGFNIHHSKTGTVYFCRLIISCCKLTCWLRKVCTR